MSEFKPFSDDTAILSVDELTVENGKQSIALYGNLTIARDQIGLMRARELKALMSSLVEALESIDNLTAKAPQPAAATEKVVKNPFA